MFNGVTLHWLFAVVLNFNHIKFCVQPLCARVCVLICCMLSPSWLPIIILLLEFHSMESLFATNLLIRRIVGYWFYWMCHSQTCSAFNPRIEKKTTIELHCRRRGLNASILLFVNFHFIFLSVPRFVVRGELIWFVHWFHSIHSPKVCAKYVLNGILRIGNQMLSFVLLKYDFMKWASINQSRHYWKY